MNSSVSFEEVVSLLIECLTAQMLKAIGTSTRGAFSLNETEYVLNLLELLQSVCQR
jgi:hypothetical protein